MKAMVLESPLPVDRSPLQLKHCPDPVPGPHEVLIEVSCCGVCHTDLHVVEGDLPFKNKPLIPGHQIVGRIKDPG